MLPLFLVCMKIICHVPVSFIVKERHLPCPSLVWLVGSLKHDEEVRRDSVFIAI